MVAGVPEEMFSQPKIEGRKIFLVSTLIHPKIFKDFSFEFLQIIL